MTSIINPNLATVVTDTLVSVNQALGHNQNSRDLAQLAANYFSMQERSLTGWLAYMRAFANELGFVDGATQNITDSWLSALPDTAQGLGLQALLAGEPVNAEIKALAMRPDIAGLLAFFTMMQYPFEQFNRFTGLHQQHYYRDVLGFKLRPPKADKSHLVLALSDDVASMTLLKGTQFNGGEDQAGGALVYQSKRNCVLNHVQVDKVLSLSRHKQHGSMLLTFARDREQGITIPDDGILTFGETALVNPERQRTPELGFTLSSPALMLSGGLRTLKIDFAEKEGVVFPFLDMTQYFDLAISGAEGMLSLNADVPFCSVDATDKQVVIVLQSLFPPVSTYFDDSLSAEEQAILSQEPFITFVLKPHMYAGSYGEVESPMLSLLRSGSFSRISLHVTVNDVGGVIANNSSTNLDTSSPFTPFTLEPRIASVFEFTHPELLVKQVEQASVTFNWLDRPQDWQQYYLAYIQYRQYLTGNTELNWQENLVDITHSDVLAQVSLGQSLFSSNAPVNNIDQHQLKFIHQPQTNGYSYHDLPLEEKRARAWPKWFSLTLSNNDFGHSEYSQVVQYTAYKNMPLYNQGVNQTKDEVEPTPIEVYQPYTPALDSLLLNYQTQAEFTLDESHNRHKLHYIHPLGSPVIQRRDTDGIALLPPLDALGSLYIGLSRVVTPGQFRLYFQLDPVDGSNISDNPNIDWHYLTESGWVFFDSSHPNSARIIEDSTYKLLDSGVITFELPELTIGANFMGDSRFWIRLSISPQGINNGDFALYSRIKQIYAQGVEVELVGLDNDPSHFIQPLAAQSITDLVVPDPNIVEVLQPYPSFGGKSAEPGSELAIRASERLRHKNRAITAWDYEHLVLAQFPELYLVRCFPERQIDSSEVVSGAVKVAMIVVPVNHNPAILQPKVPLYLKRKIQRYVEQVAPLGVISQVYDPVYEEVELELFAKISSDFDIESVAGELNQIIVDYMTPWNGVHSSHTGLATDIYLTELSMVLERHLALEKIYVMRARQALSKGGVKRYSAKNLADNRIEPSELEAMLVSKVNHKINLFNTHVELFEGIGKYRLELDFTVG
ncbi:hypothetical protein HQQ94_09595 [Shewanella sp. VB17]|uniref:hypothetical protein n=1 Tax=Shewanella sp. VB17 TaxID=2739432 RepID=UPI001567336B|nr:hypothetical protein [Shewanella sp. VB17]NRD73494.1 hypothetical protein [Shewanella sp. VB17]